MSLFKWVPAGVLGGVGYTQQDTIADVAEAPLEIVKIVRTQVELSSIQKLVLMDSMDGSFSTRDFRGYLRTRLLSNSDRDVSLDPWENPYNIRIYQNKEYEIWSYGPDQIDDTQDDIWVAVPFNGN